MHMRDQKNMIKGLFLEAKHDLLELRLGVKMWLFLRKKVLLDPIEGHLGVIFHTPPKMFSKKACLGANTREIFVKGMFFLERANRH